jgi:hypothetical protein
MQGPTASPTTLVTESHGVTVLSLPCPGPVMAGLVVLYGQADGRTVPAPCSATTGSGSSCILMTGATAIS